MRSALAFICNVCLLHFAHAQNAMRVYDFYLVNTADSSKRFKLRSDEPLSFSHYIAKTDPTQIPDQVTWTGTPVYMTDSGIGMRMVKKTLTRNGAEGLTTTEFSYHDQDSVRTFLFPSTGMEIRTAGSGRRVISGIGAALLVLGCASPLYVPLVTIDYDNWTVDKKRFNNYFIAGGAAFLSGYLMMAVGSPIRYRIVPKNTKPDSRYWYLTSKAKQ